MGLLEQLPFGGKEVANTVGGPLQTHSLHEEDGQDGVGEHGAKPEDLQVIRQGFSLMTKNFQHCDYISNVSVLT